jgi:cobalt-zinc-cadmium resistance protein CzcA
VVTASPTLGPLEIEQYVTYAVESALSGLPGVEELRSISRYGISSVTVVFEDGTSPWFARQLVQERLAQAREMIPEGLGTPEMAAPSTGLGEIYQFVLHGPGRSPMELREILDWQVACRLRQVPGVVEVNAWGGVAKQFQVAIDPAALLAHGVPLSRVMESIRQGNALAGSAYIEKRKEQILIRGEGLIRGSADLQDVVVDMREGVPVRVRDLGKVVEAGAPRRGSATAGGEGETVIGIVQMLAGENARTVTRRVQDAVADIQHDLTDGVRIVPYYERTELVDRTISTVAWNLTEGCLLVMAVLFLLLGHLRGGLIVAL